MITNKNLPKPKSFSSDILGPYEGLKGYTPKVIQDSMSNFGRFQYENTLYRAEYLVRDIHNQEIAIANFHFTSLTVMQVSILLTTFISN
jgi:hypothetical protein